jgi:hypothetical protein
MLGIRAMRHDCAIIKTLAFCITVYALLRLSSEILETPGLLFEDLIKDHGTLQDRVVNSPSVEHLVFP